VVAVQEPLLLSLNVETVTIMIASISLEDLVVVEDARLQKAIEMAFNGKMPIF